MNIILDRELSKTIKATKHSKANKTTKNTKTNKAKYTVLPLIIPAGIIRGRELLEVLKLYFLALQKKCIIETLHSVGWFPPKALEWV